MQVIVRTFLQLDGRAWRRKDLVPKEFRYRVGTCLLAQWFPTTHDAGSANKPCPRLLSLWVPRKVP